MLTWENPPETDEPWVPTREEIGKALMAEMGRWAIVARHDRHARAERHAERIVSGTEYGRGYRSRVRRVGNEHRVYAKYVG